MSAVLDHARRVLGLTRFAAWFAGQFLHANAVIAWDLLTPGLRARPAVVEIELRCRTPVETSLLTGLVALTPGTLPLGLRSDPPRMEVHGMYSADPDHFRAQLHDLEDRLLAALRTEVDGAEPAPRGARR
jgi:multicomponent Na+:H+ antiporter subunit E